MADIDLFAPDHRKNTAVAHLNGRRAMSSTVLVIIIVLGIVL